MFFVNWVVSSSSSSGHFSFTFTSNLYPSNSSNSSKRKLKNISGNYIYFDFVYQYINILNVNGDEYVVLCYSTDVLAFFSATIKSGTDTISSKTSSWTAGTVYELSGFGFMFYQSNGTDYFLMRLDNGNVSISHTASSSAISIDASCYSYSGTTSYLSNSTRCKSFINNI